MRCFLVFGGWGCGVLKLLADGLSVGGEGGGEGKGDGGEEEGDAGVEGERDGGRGGSGGGGGGGDGRGGRVGGFDAVAGARGTSALPLGSIGGRGRHGQGR